MAQADPRRLNYFIAHWAHNGSQGMNRCYIFLCLFYGAAATGADAQTNDDVCQDGDDESSGVCLLQQQAFLRRHATDRPWLRLMKHHEGLTHEQLREDHLKFKVSKKALRQAMRLLDPEKKLKDGEEFMISASILNTAQAEVLESDACKDILDNAQNLPEMTAMEREKYCTRFARAMREDAAVSASSGKNDLDENNVEEIMVQELINQYPVVTEHEVEKLNADESVHWEAGISEWQ